MKKVLAILALAAAMSLAQAQNCHIVEHHGSNDNLLSSACNITELRSGNILFNFEMVPIQVPTGWNRLFLVSHDDATPIDSVDNENQGFSWFIEPHPQEGYCFFFITSDSNGKSHLVMQHLNEDLHFQEISMAIGLEHPFADYYSHIIPDGEDGLVAWYMTGPMAQMPGQFQYNTNVLSRIGFDGTIRDIVTYNRQTFPVWYTHFEMKDFGMKRWNDSPREYVAYGLNADTILGDNHKFHYCVLDSLFGIRETLKLDDTDIPEGFNFHNESHNQILPLDDGTYLITTAYLKWSGDGEQGVQVSKRDKSTHQTLATAYFPEDYLYDEEKVIGLERSPDGGVYLAYMVSTYNNGSVIGQVAVVKMDKNLNVEWQRHCLESTKEPYSAIMRVMSNGDMAIGGTAAEEGMDTGIFFIVFNDEGLCITEPEAIIRPYTCYPNPAQDRLHLQYSPDVQPKEIELYDLQGRLVRTQNKDLESLSLQGLPAGTYTMRIILEDGKVYSDKVVKE